MNLRNRLIWIAALTVAFAGVQLVASRRNAQRELVEFLKDKLLPLANECAREHSPAARGVLTLQVHLNPDGKLDSQVERVEQVASSELQEPKLVECLREHAKTLTLKHPLPAPEQLELKLPISAEPERQR